MNLFEKDKAGKLKRLPVLRIMNALGMIRWDEDQYNCAQQKLRILHPLSWPWIAVQILLAFVMYGVVDVAKELKSVWRDDCVCW